VESGTNRIMLHGKWHKETASGAITENREQMKKPPSTTRTRQGKLHNGMRKFPSFSSKIADFISTPFPTLRPTPATVLLTTEALQDYDYMVQVVQVAGVLLSTKLSHTCVSECV